MKFLTIAKIKDMALTLPPALGRQLTEASAAVVNKQKKEGKILEVYWIPGAGTMVTISEFKTAEEMVNSFNQAPVANYTSFENYPLADFNESMQIIIERLKELEKMIPPAGHK
jgi:hypothetical protein